MNLIEQFKSKAKERPLSIVFPECDPRVLEAANIVLEEGIGYPVLLGTPVQLAQIAMDLSLIHI